MEPGNVYEFLSDAYQAKGDKAAAKKELEKYNEVGGRSPLLVERLAKLQEEAGEPKKAAATLDRLNYIYPEDQELHKQLGDLWLAQDNVPRRHPRISGVGGPQAAGSGDGALSARHRL